MEIYRQYGNNSNYPEEIETWRWGDKIPEWISDKAKVTFIDGDGNITLETRETNTGGIEISNSSGTDILLKLGSKSDIVCKNIVGDSDIFVLSPIQLKLLYKLIKNN